MRTPAGPEIERLAELLARLPGLGARSAQKAVLTLLKKRNELLIPLAAALQDAIERIRECPECGNLDTAVPCSLCQDPRRDRAMIAVVAEVGDLWALERTGAVRCLYHVLGGHLSPLDGIGPSRLNIPRLIERVRASGVTEVLLALNATVEGQATAHYLADQLAPTGVTVSRLAQGVPMGGEVSVLDDGTLATAIRARKQY